MGEWTTAQAQALTVPCYALGAISYLVVARISDHQQLRGLYQVIFLVVCIIGYGISLAPAPSSVHYFAIFIISLGLFVVVGLPLAWLPSNNPRYGKRTTASAIQITICNCSGILAPFVSNMIIETFPQAFSNMTNSYIPPRTVLNTLWDTQFQSAYSA